tara:strand:+ start:416 stop:1276 length:861 start_codon:yes stop_codon:yes gene_type:complete
MSSSVYNGIFLGSEAAALLVDRIFQFLVDILKPVYTTCDEEPSTMKDCIVAISTFSELIFDKYSRQLEKRHSDIGKVIASALRTLASETVTVRTDEERVNIAVTVDRTKLIHVFTKRILLAVAKEPSVENGSFFNTSLYVASTIVVQKNVRDVLWGMTDDYVKIAPRRRRQRRTDDEEDESEDRKERKKKKKKKHKKNKKRKEKKGESESDDSDDKDDEAEAAKGAAEGDARGDDKSDKSDNSDAEDNEDGIEPSDSVSQIFSVVSGASKASKATSKASKASNKKK